MSIIPLDLERRFERRWAARFSAVPQEHRVERQGQQLLDAWLQGPGKFVRGTKMIYSVPEEKDRQDVIAYLKTLPKGWHLQYYYPPRLSPAWIRQSDD